MIQMLADNDFFFLVKIKSFLSTLCGLHIVTPFQRVQYGKGGDGERN